MHKALIVIIALAVVLVAGLVLVLSKGETAGPTTQSLTAPVTIAPARPNPEALLRAVDRNDLEAAKAVLTMDPALVNEPAGEAGETALHHARSIEMAKLLLDHKADPNARDKHFNARPVRWQIRNWQPDVAKLLEEAAGPDEDIAYYVSAGKIEPLTKLLSADPSQAKMVTDKDALGGKRSLLHLAAQYGQPEAASVLIKHGADVGAKGGFFDAEPLEAAAWAGQTEVVRVLIAAGANVDAVVHTTDQGDHTAIWWGALTGRKEIVKMLLDAGATVEPALVEKMYETESKPYPGRNLPPRADYDAVIEMLEKKVDALPAK